MRTFISEIVDRATRAILLPDAGGWILRRGLASAAAALLGFIPPLVALGLQPCASAAQARSNEDSRAAVGTLKIWVPSGSVGDLYWIYLNGQIVGAPHRETSQPKCRAFFLSDYGGWHKPNDGWFIHGCGLRLEMHHELFDNLNWYLHFTEGKVEDSKGNLVDSCQIRPLATPPTTECPLSYPLDGLGLFRAFDISLRPNKYTVEVAILSNDWHSSFPFAITRKHFVDVSPDETTQIYIAIPDGYIDVPQPMPAAAAFCQYPGRLGLGVVRQLSGWIAEYQDNPMVKILEAQYAKGSSAKGVVVLDLPPDQGGAREFDGDQIRLIAKAIQFSSQLPSRKEIAACGREYPEFASSYAQVDKMISLVEDDIKSFYDLATTLGTKQWVSGQYP